jgi:hypothetical protein
MFSFFPTFNSKKDPLSEIHTESRNASSSDQTIQKSLENAQKAEFAALTRIQENKFEKDTWDDVKQTSWLKTPKALTSYGSLKLGQWLTLRPSHTTLQRTFDDNLSNLNNETAKVNLTELETIKSEVTRINSSTLITENHDLKIEDCEINQKLSSLANITALESHNFQKNIGFWVPVGVGATLLALKTATILSSRKN